MRVMRRVQLAVGLARQGAGRLIGPLTALAGAATVLTVSTTLALAAASVTNRDEKDHKITIIEGDKKQDFMLKPNQALENICIQGCTLRLNDSDDDEYQLEANDIVSIEDNYLYYDTAEAETETKPDEKKKP
jgi:hypothetical protein